MSISEEKVKELMVAFSPDGSGGELNLNEFDEMIDEFVQLWVVTLSFFR